MEKPINPQKLSSLMLEKFSDMGMLEKKGGKYFLTDSGRLLLANFGIEENEIY